MPERNHEIAREIAKTAAMLRTLALAQGYDTLAQLLGEVVNEANDILTELGTQRSPDVAAVTLPKRPDHAPAADKKEDS